MRLSSFFAAALFALSVPFAADARSAQADHAPRGMEGGQWLSGDLHVHSRHSRDSTNNPVAKILDFARSAGMGFLLISDHDNHWDGDVAHHTWADPDYTADDLVLLYGAEWTTNRGHASVFAAHPYDHRAMYDIRDARDWDIRAVKQRLGVHLSANHPSGKDHFGFSFDLADSLEVWNSVKFEENEAAILIWDDMLRSGRMLTGRGGSDSHHGQPKDGEPALPQSIEATANYVGTPTTWVYAAQRTPEAVIAALDSGRVSISSNPFGPRVELTADTNGDGRPDMMMGDNGPAPAHAVKFTVHLAGALQPGTYHVKIVKDGSAFTTLDISGSADATFTDTPAAKGRTYYRVEVRGPQTPFPQLSNWVRVAGDMVALSNPIYFNFDPDF